MKKILLALACALMVTACGGGGKDDPNGGGSGKINSGEWQLSKITTKATLGDETVNVYIDFNDDKTFSLYQMLGTGRYRLHTGNWTLTGKSLSGSYSGGTAWSSTYEVTQDNDNTLTLTSVSANASVTEVDTYTRTTIPESVKSSVIANE